MLEFIHSYLWFSVCNYIFIFLDTKMNTFLDFIDPTAKNGNWKGSDTIWATENTTWTDGKTNGVMKEGTDADGTEKEIVGVAQIGTKANTVIYVVYLKAKT